MTRLGARHGDSSVKNHTDMLIFHTAICAGASQIATDGRRELDVLVATPSLRSGMDISMSEKMIESRSEAETFAVGSKLGESAKSGDIFLLDGDLGVGKTVFAKGVAAGLGIDEPVVSPTFTIVHEYEGRLPLYHFDVYRIADPDEMYEIGFDEYLYGDGVCLIEWPSQVEELLPEEAVRITIEKDMKNGPDYRRITIAEK